MKIQRLSQLKELLARGKVALFPSHEGDSAAAFWAGLRDYHETNEGDAVSDARSQWLAKEVIQPLEPTSVVELGCNSGRNLRALRATLPSASLLGVDINSSALDFARSLAVDHAIDFREGDARVWDWGERDVVLTMSVLDHIPDDDTRTVLANAARNCRYFVAVELFDGGHGTRGLFKYSRNTSEFLNDAGFEIVAWEPALHQYDTVSSPLFLCVGRIGTP